MQYFVQFDVHQPVDTHALPIRPYEEWAEELRMAVEGS